MELVARTYRSRGRCINKQRAEGVTIDIAYDDAWGRVCEYEMDVPGLGTYTTQYDYWFGDKLKRVTSNVPGMTPLVNYLYDGLGKRLGEFWGHDHLIRGESLQSTACNRLQGIKYHVPRTLLRTLQNEKEYYNTFYKRNERRKVPDLF